MVIFLNGATNNPSTLIVYDLSEERLFSVPQSTKTVFKCRLVTVVCDQLIAADVGAKRSRICLIDNAFSKKCFITSLFCLIFLSFLTFLTFELNLLFICFHRIFNLCRKYHGNVFFMCGVSIWCHHFMDNYTSWYFLRKNLIYQFKPIKKSDDKCGWRFFYFLFLLKLPATRHGGTLACHAFFPVLPFYLRFVSLLRFFAPARVCFPTVKEVYRHCFTDHFRPLTHPVHLLFSRLLSLYFIFIKRARHSQPWKVVVRRKWYFCCFAHKTE